MAHAVPPRSIAVAAKADDQAWRGRTLVACSLLGVGVIGFGAVNLDWSDGLAAALGQAAGMATPLVAIGLVVWAAAAGAARRR